MNKPKYQIGDRFGGWVIVHVSYLKTHVYKLHNNLNDGLLVMSEELIEKIFADEKFVKYQSKST